MKQAFKNPTIQCCGITDQNRCSYRCSYIIQTANTRSLGFCLEHAIGYLHQGHILIPLKTYLKELKQQEEEPTPACPYYIYTLTDPRDHAVHYVGISKHPKERLGQHIRPGETCNPIKDAWITDLQQNGLLPQQHIIDTAPNRKEAGQREKHWITHYTNQHAPLTNRSRKSIFWQVGSEAGL